jgi:creatinine amidohydrolase
MVTAENTWEQIAEAQPEIALVSIATIEQHGRHLPVGTDWLIAVSMAEELGRELNAYVLPPMPFGCSVEHMAFPGTVTLKPTTLALFLDDIVTSLYRQGFRKIVLLSTHGGNWVLKPTMRELNYQYPDLQLVWTGPMSAEPPREIHSGAWETSLIMHYHPELVGEAREDCQPTVTQEYCDYVGYEAYTETGVWGVPSEAAPEKGQQWARESIAHEAKYIRETFARLDEMAAGRADQ